MVDVASYLRELYSRRGLTLREISAFLAVSPATVRRWLVRLNIPRRGRGRPVGTRVAWKLTEKDVATIRQQLTKGVSQAQLARQYRVSRQLIHQIKHWKIWK